MIRTLMCIACFVVLTLSSLAIGQEKLEYKRAEGTMVTRSDLKFDQKLTIAGMDVKTVVVIQTVTSRTAAKRNSEGKQRLTDKIERMKVNMDFPGGIKIDFDSEKPEAKSPIPELQVVLDMFRAMVGLSYVIVTGPDHLAVAIEGVDQILAALPSNVAEQLKQYLNPAQLKREHNQEVAVIPSDPVKKGDRWRRVEDMDIGAGQRLTFVNYYEYLGATEKNGRKLDRIGMYSESVTYVQEEAGPSPLKVVKSELMIESSKRTVLFDRELGQIVERSGQAHITGQMTFSINNMELPGTLDLTIEQEDVTAPKK